MTRFVINNEDEENGNVKINDSVWCWFKPFDMYWNVRMAMILSIGWMDG